MGFGLPTLLKGPRVQPSVLWTLAVDDATVDEGTPLTFTTTINRQGSPAQELTAYFRIPSAVGNDLITANEADFASSLVDDFITAVAATTGATLIILGANDLTVLFSDAWNGTFSVMRTPLNNPALQGDKHTALELYRVNQGAISVGAVLATITDTTLDTSVPENTTAPSLSDTTPAVGSAVLGSDGAWSHNPTSYIRKWQRQVSVAATPVTFTDNFNRANEVLTTSPNWLHEAGTVDHLVVASNALSTGAGVGTIALYAAAGEVNHAIQFKVKTSSGPRERGIIKYVDANNYIALEVSKTLAADGIRALVIVGGVTSTTHTFSTSPRVFGETYYLECVGNVLTFKRNGVIQGTPYTLSAPEQAALAAATDRGIGTAATGGVGNVDDLVVTDFVAGSPLAEDIPDAVAQSFTPTSSQLGLPIRFGSLASNSNGPATEYAFSAWSSNVEAAPAVELPVNTVAPSTSTADPQVGVTISGNLGTWSNNPTSFEAKWQEQIAAVWTDIAGATSVDYLPVAANIGNALRFAVRATNAGGTTAYSFSAATNAVIDVPVADATDASLGPSYGPSVLRNAAEDTLVGVITADGTLHTVEIIGTGDYSSRFKIVESPPGTFSVLVAATAPDFLRPAAINIFSRTAQNPHSIYSLPLRFNAARPAPFDKTFPIRRKEPDLAAVITGGAGGSESSANSAATIFSTSGLLGTGSTTRIVHVPDHNVHGIFKHSPTTPNAKEDGRSNCTYVGHPGGVLRQGRGLQKKVGSNVIYQNIPFLAGGHQSTPEQYSLIDTIEFGNMVAGETNVVRLLRFFHTQHYYSLDELFSGIGFGPYPKEFLIDYCDFSVALHDRRQPSNIPHPYGPLFHTYSSDLVMHHNLFAGSPMRMPRYTNITSGVVKNNVIFPRSTNLSGHSVISLAGGSGPSAAQEETIEVAGNIIIPDTTVSYATLVQMIVGLLDLTANGLNKINLNIGVPGKENFIVKMVNGSPDFANAIPLSDVNIRKQGFTSTLGMITNTPAFDSVSDHDYQVTNTPADLEAIYDEVMDNAGSRKQVGNVYTGDFISGDLALNHVGYLIRQALRTTANCGYPTIASLATAWDTEWAGGGTLGFGMHYLHNGTTWTEGGV